MPDGLAQPAAVALVPCFNEGRNPEQIAAALSEIAGLQLRFLDDGSDEDSRAVLEALSASGKASVVRNEARAGKVRSLLTAMRDLESGFERLVLIDCDVVVSAGGVVRVLDELQRADLVLVNAVAMTGTRTLWERGAAFSAKRHERLRARALKRYPALFANGRLLGMSRRMVEAVLRSDVPPHTEDAHFMLTCLREGYRFAYLSDAVVRYRAPSTLQDYLRQSNRFSAGRDLLRERWSDKELARSYDPRPSDLVVTAAAEALHDPLGAVVFATMLAAKALRRPSAAASSGLWPVSRSTKVLR
jgi:cellulose synthase/poly-beta-1,6-N-acetylglucosamine synthase-like glycosyltransferase